MKLVKFVEAFFETRIGGEVIDHLPISCGTHQKADFLLFDRSVVVEMKELIDARIDKVRKVINFWRALPDWPLMPDGSLLQDVLSRHPRGEEINAELRDANIQSIEKLVKDANRQIRDTRSVLGIDQTLGLLAIVNEHVDVLDPRVISGTVDGLLKKLLPSGASRFPCVDLVIVFTTAHTVVEPDGQENLIIPSVARPDHPRLDEITSVSREIMKAWAEVLGRNLIDRGVIVSPEELKKWRIEGKTEPPIV